MKLLRAMTKAFLTMFVAAVVVAIVTLPIIIVGDCFGWGYGIAMGSVLVMFAGMTLCFYREMDGQLPPPKGSGLARATLEI